MSTTFEEAKLCPKCGRPGDDRKQTQARNGRGRPVEVHLIYCTTKLCRWYDTSWVVQINEDGSIPEAFSQIGDKQYPAVSDETATRIQEMTQRQLEAETRPGGGEIRNPHGN